MCGQLNEVMAEHFSPTGDGGKRMDLEQHPQLNSGSVELIAPAEYMVSRVWPGPPSLHVLPEDPRHAEALDCLLLSLYL